MFLTWIKNAAKIALSGIAGAVIGFYLAEYREKENRGAMLSQIEEASKAELGFPPLFVALGAKPPITQKSIDLAVSYFGISVPENAKGPFLDPTLDDRGLTTFISFPNEVVVTIGPFAFESWGMLAATLAHELEVHAVQHIVLAVPLDAIGLNWTTRLERQAYDYEVANAGRFWLSDYDVLSTLGTKDHYHPAHGLKDLSEFGAEDFAPVVRLVGFHALEFFSYAFFFLGLSLAAIRQGGQTIRRYL